MSTQSPRYRSSSYYRRLRRRRDARHKLIKSENADMGMDTSPPSIDLNEAAMPQKSQVYSLNEIYELDSSDAEQDEVTENIDVNCPAETDKEEGLVETDLDVDDTASDVIEVIDKEIGMISASSCNLDKEPPDDLSKQLELMIKESQRQRNLWTELNGAK